MRHLKHFENLSDDLSDDIKISAGYYIESQLPKKFYFDWEHRYDEDSEGYITYDFYYDDAIDEDTIEEIDNFFNEHNIEYDFNIGLHSLADKNVKSQTQIYCDLHRDMIEKFADYYDQINKYNL